MRESASFPPHLGPAPRASAPFFVLGPESAPPGPRRPLPLRRAALRHQPEAESRRHPASVRPEGDPPCTAIRHLPQPSPRPSPSAPRRSAAGTLPNGRRQGRYWVAGNIDGARGRSLFVRLRGPGIPGKWTDAADGSHGDLLDLIRHRSRANSLRDALDEARSFLALPTLPATSPDGSWDSGEAARRLWQRCRAVGGTHAERYLRARGLMRCRFAGPALPSRASPPRGRGPSAASRRWSPP